MRDLVPEPDPELRDGVWAGFLGERPQIRVAARCIFRRARDGAVLVIRAHDEVKRETFYIPPGGGVRFSERGEEAVRREVKEELGSGVRDLRLRGVLENLFTHRGVAGHEIVLVFEGELEDAGLEERDEFEVIDGGERLTGHWLPLSGFRSRGGDGRPPLYPDGLLGMLGGAAAG